MIKTIPKKKNCKNTKWLSEEPLQTAKKRREAKGKGEKETYSFEFRVPKNSKEREESLPQRSVQRKEENNRMGKTRDLFKKIRHTNETFHAKMGTIKDRNGMDLTEGEEVARIHRRTVQKRSS